MTPIIAFELNMADAYMLVKSAVAFDNQRAARRMRAELRRRVGDALKIPQKRRDELNCLQSDDLFVVFLPGASVTPGHFSDSRPLLRQAIVAACAALETYIGDVVMKNVGPLLKSQHTATKRLLALPMSLDDWLFIDSKYQRPRWGLRELVVQPYVRENASTSPTKVGNMLSLVGVDDWSRKVDAARGVSRGDTVAFLERITERRNRIAHQGDRAGRGRAALTVAEVQADLACIESVASAIEVVVAASARTR
jgi:hypothetical protein